MRNTIQDNNGFLVQLTTYNVLPFPLRKAIKTLQYGTPQLSYVSFFAAIVTNFVTCSTSFVMCSKNFFMCSTNFVMRSKNFFMCSTKFVMCSKNFFMCSKNSGFGEICDYCGRFLILWSFRPVNHRNFCLHAIGKFTMDYTLDSLAWKQKEKWRATREESDRLVSLLLCTACRRQISPNLHAIKRREQQLKEADFLRSTDWFLLERGKK